MMKRLLILLFAVAAAVPTMAQRSVGGGDAKLGPHRTNWQVSAILGSSNMFNLNTEDYLLSNPSDNFNSDYNIGIGMSNWGNSTNESANPNMYLRMDDISTNSMVNIIGLQGQYFITSRIAVNAAFSMNIGITPKKDYIEGDNTVTDMVIPGNSYITGQLKSNWFTSVGGNYYFPTRNDRINLYAGAQLGFQMGRIKTQTPYTGVTVTDPTTGDELPAEMYYANNDSGQVIGLSGSAVAGIEYALAEGLIIGFEVMPVSYTYNRFTISPQGFSNYYAHNHNINIFALPNVKFGFRF